MTGKKLYVSFFVRIRKKLSQCDARENKTSPGVSARGLKKITPCSATQRETKLRFSQFRSRISNTTLALDERTNLSTGTAIMGRNSVAMSCRIS